MLYIVSFLVIPMQPQEWVFQELLFIKDFMIEGCLLVAQFWE